MKLLLKRERGCSRTTVVPALTTHLVELQACRLRLLAVHLRLVDELLEPGLVSADRAPLLAVLLLASGLLLLLGLLDLLQPR